MRRVRLSSALTGGEGSAASSAFSKNRSRRPSSRRSGLSSRLIGKPSCTGPPEHWRTEASSLNLRNGRASSRWTCSGSRAVSVYLGITFVLQKVFLFLHESHCTCFSQALRQCASAPFSSLAFSWSVVVSRLSERTPRIDMFRVQLYVFEPNLKFGHRFAKAVDTWGLRPHSRLWLRYS